MIRRKTTIQALKEQDLILKDYHISIKSNVLEVHGDTSFVYGLGERFNQVNQKGLLVENKVQEQFCNQGDKTYFPLPFFFLEKNFGLFIKTKKVFTFDFSKTIKLAIQHLDDDTEVYIFSGDYKDMIRDFISLTGEPLLPPKWVLGPWMSAHRWNSQEMITKQIRKVEELHLPITSLVIEQWSDEATFYIFNKGEYQEGLMEREYEDYSFQNNPLWPNPKKMIDEIHESGIKVLLWQAPVIKELEEKDEANAQHAMDQEFVVEHDLVVKNETGTYKIPSGHWFPGSMIPDFTNPLTVKWWFARRTYLSDIGIDGYKTDGGEFVHDLETRFANKETGLEMVNDYARSYIDAYKKNLRDDQILFSRAGYIGQQSLGIQWSGDQKSTWSELQAVYKAGLSLSLSGQHLWSFDIGGFAGDLPSVELYIRSTQLAVFSPVMQFHSEPVGGQFALLDPSEEMNNERSPWNIANHYKDETLMPYIKKLYWLRMNLIPYLYSELCKAVEQKTTLMKHLMIDFPTDKDTYLINQQHLLGEIMFIPVLQEGIDEVEVYFPKGRWINIFTKEEYLGNATYKLQVPLHTMLAFVPEGTAIVTSRKNFFDKATNELETGEYYIHLYGDKGQYQFVSEKVAFDISWEDGHYKVNNSMSNMTILFE